MTPLWYYSLLSLTFIITIKFLLQNQSRRLKNLPPGPPNLPIIGNLHHLKPPIHRTFTTLSHKYGDIISLWFGSRLVVVVSSPSIVQECFSKNDIILANRPRFLAGKYISYNYTTLGSASYGDHWRNLRRITTIDVLSNHRLNSFVDIRRDESKRLVLKLGHDTNFDEFTKVEVRSRLTEMTFNSMMRMISGKRYYGEDIDVSDVEEAKQFREIITEMMSLSGANNKSDFLPLLRLFDFEDLEKRLERIGKRADAFLQGLIEEHRSGKHSADTMTEHLLKLQETQPEYYSDHMIKGLIQMDPEGALVHSRTRALRFENADNMGAWVIHPGATRATYTGPTHEVIGTGAAGPQQRTDRVETIEISLPPPWLILQHMIEQGELEILPPLVQPVPAAAPDVPPADIAMEGEEDPEEIPDEEPEYHPLSDEDDDSPDEGTVGVGGHPDLPNGHL